MKVFDAHYLQTGGWGLHEEYQLTIVANSEQDALDTEAGV